MIKRGLFSISAIILLSIACYAQEDYYYTGTAYHVGSELVNGGVMKNCQVCQVRIGFSGVKDYTPDEVSEYGFKSGTVYIARSILVEGAQKKVFLQRLIKGKMNLYYYSGQSGKKFFAEIDSGTLIPLGASRKYSGSSYFRDKLAEMTPDCDKVKGKTELILYKPASLASFVDVYNKCEAKNFPYVKYGFLYGYVNSVFTIPPGVETQFLKGSSIESDGSMTAGLFLDNPIGQKGLSVHTELQYIRNNFNYFAYKINKIWMAINTSCINIPVMVRYTLPAGGSKLRPYLNAGGELAISLGKDSKVLEDVMSGSVVLSESIYSVKLLPDYYVGYNAGGGLEFNIHGRMNLYAELRYSASSPMAQPTLLGKRNLFLLTGISF
jgi:hypothetical protein